jgi:excisionase family DNA binding protein
MRHPASTGAAGYLPGLSGADASSDQSAAPTTLIGIDELSRRLSISKGTLYNWVYLRRIPFIKAGRCLRFDYDAVFQTLRQITMDEAGRR